MDEPTLHLAPIELVALAQRAVNAVATLAWQRGKVHVTLESSRAELWAMADKERLWQILIKLLHHATSHTLPGGVVLIRLQGQPVTVTIQVQNTSEETHPADLPNFKDILAAMGGKITIESIPGQRNCYRITLPRARYDEQKGGT